MTTFQNDLRDVFFAEDAGATMTLREWREAQTQPAPEPRPYDPVAALGSVLRQVVNLSPEWMTRGACRGANPDTFFPAQGDNSGARVARAVCATCPVQAECLSFALATGQKHGVWGGMSERERRPMRGGPRVQHCEACGVEMVSNRTKRSCGTSKCDYVIRRRRETAA